MVDEALRERSFAPASESKLSKATEVQEAIRDVTVGNEPGHNGTPKRVPKHLSQRAASPLVTVFNAIFRTQYFPLVWKNARITSILKTGMETLLLLSYRPVSLLNANDTFLTDPTLEDPK
jgi:hypothetical protein